MTEPSFDLFGERIDPRRGLSGRPRHFPTRATRAVAAAMHQAGHSQPQIAAALRITRPTLVRHYAAEIGSLAAIGRQYRKE